MTIEAQEYHPDYFIRMLGQLYNELVLRNVFNVFTGVYTTDVNGRFEIILDNSNPITETYGIFHLIQPMDYVEIFFTRQQYYAPPPSSFIVPSGVKAAPSVSAQTVTANQQQSVLQWGYIDGIGNFHPARPFVYAADGTIQPFIKDSSGNMVANGGFPDAVYAPNTLSLDSITLGSGISLARPLSPAEKVNTPTFCFSGFVDSISSEFAIDASGKVTPIIRIVGKSVGKILTTHEIFQQSIILDTAVINNVTKQVAGQDPSNAAIIVLNTFLKDFLNLVYNPTQSAASQPLAAVTNLTQNRIVSYTVSAPLAQSGSSASAPYSIPFNVYLRNFVSVLNYTIANFSDGDPTDTAISGNTGLSVGLPILLGDGDPNYLGRMLNTNQEVGQQKVFHLGGISNGPILSTLEQMCNTFLNELWVDEAGRLVLRRIEDAWFQDIFVEAPPANNSNVNNNSSGSVLNLKLPVYVQDQDGNPIPQLKDPSARVAASDIIGWNLVKSDDNLKTLVMVEDAFNQLAIFDLSQIAGMAPLTVEGRLVVAQETLQAAITGLQSQIPTATYNTIFAQFSGTPAGQLPTVLPSIEQELVDQVGSSTQTEFGISISELIQNLNDFISGAKQLTSQPLTVWTHFLQDDQSVIRYWQTFLFRPKVIPSVFIENSLFAAVSQAEVYFQQFAAFMLSGNIVVKGDPKYKAGKRYYFEQLNADFYITGVEHNFPWGSGPYTTTLHVSRGIFHGRPGGFYPTGTVTKSTVWEELMDNADTQVGDVVVQQGLV